MGMNKKITQAVMLAGGMGVRLRPLTIKTPKPMVRVHGRPFVEYLIDFLKQNGIEEVVMLLGYLPEKVIEHLGDGSKFGIRVKYSIGAVDDYTGTRVRNAKHLLDDQFLLLYCDNYLPLNVQKLAAFHAEKNAQATVTVYTNKDGRTKSNMLVDGDGFVATYDRSRKTPGMNGVDMGFFIMKKEVVDAMPAGNFWLEEETMPRLIASRNLAGFKVDHVYYSLATPERMVVLERFFAPKKIVFVERNALIQKTDTNNTLRSWETFEFSKEGISALQSLRDKGFDTHIVSSYEDVKLGTMNDNDTRRIYLQTEEALAPHGITLAGIYDCPHGVEAGCECHMPRPGLLIQAGRDYCLDLTKAVFFAGTPAGEAAGEAVGCRTFRIRSAEDFTSALSSLS